MTYLTLERLISVLHDYPTCSTQIELIAFHIDILCATRAIRVVLTYENPQAEQAKPSQAQNLLGIGLSRDETEHTPSLLGQTKTETEHLVAPRDQAEPSNLTLKT